MNSDHQNRIAATITALTHVAYENPEARDVLLPIIAAKMKDLKSSSKKAPKKEAPKKEAPKKEAPKKEAPKKEAPKKEKPSDAAPVQKKGSPVKGKPPVKTKSSKKRKASIDITLSDSRW